MSACQALIFLSLLRSRRGLWFITDRVVCFRWIKGTCAKTNLFTLTVGLDKLLAKREQWIRYSLARNELRIALEFQSASSGRAMIQLLGYICRHMN